MLRRRRPRAAVPAVSLLASAASAIVLSLIVAGSAIAATVPLNGRTFDAACGAAAAGDVITVPAGSFGSQTVSCQKAVTFQLDPGAQLSYLNFSGANGPTVAGGTITGSSDSGAVQIFRASNVTLRGAHINNTVYVEGSVNATIDGNVIEPAAGGTSWSNGDMVDVYEQSRTPQVNTGLTISNNVLHGLRSPTSTSHSDAIQFCDCGNADQIPQNIKIVRNKFYDNECMNIRTNDKDDLLVENNLIGDTVTGISGCGSYSLDVIAANATVRYNTFTGRQKIQVDSSYNVGQRQTWVGNAGVGMSSSCGATNATYSRNVWTGQKCGSTDKQVSSLKLNSDGTPQSGSPVIDAGDGSAYPGVDFNGATRFVGAGPDAGAFEFGATVGGPPPAGGGAPGGGSATPAPPAPSSTAPTDAGLVAAGSAPAGLVAAFGFDEPSGNRVADVSGNGLFGLLHGVRHVKAGRFGGALAFNGSRARVTVHDDPRLRLAAGMTLEAWVKPSAPGRSRLVLGRTTRRGLAYGLYASNRRAPAGTVRTVVAKASAVRRARARTRLPLGRWSHVAVTFDGKMVRIYVDGQWVSSRKAAGSLVDAAGALRIGGGATRSTSFRGLIDEVRIYDHALTGAQIQADLARPIT